MNKSQLIKAVAKSSGLTINDTTSVINATISTIEDTLVAGEPVSLVGHFSLKPIVRAARVGVNPSTGEAIKIAASNGVKYKVGSSFKAKLNA